MSDQTNIEWCDSTFNPWIGCTKISPACDHCYAERLDGRGIFGGNHWGPGAPRKRTSDANWRKPVQWNAQEFVECPACGWRGEWREADVRNGCCPSCNHLPERFKPARRRVFCASLADWLDKDVPHEWTLDLLGLIFYTPNLDWLLLTKRIGNLRTRLMMVAAIAQPPLRQRIEAWLNGTPPKNVWLGATICNQQEADRDIPKLLAVPAAVRFLSIEPMLGPVDLRRWVYHREREISRAMNGPAACNRDQAEAVIPHPGIHWVIAGGESGPQARPSHPDWFRSLRDQCKAAGVPFLFKQWGEWLPGASFTPELAAKDGDPHRSKFFCALWRDKQWSLGHPYSDEFYWREEPMYRVGKPAAGRLLDGVTHNGFPESNT